MISESTRFLAQPREMRLTVITDYGSGRVAKTKNGGQRPPRGEGRSGANLLFLRGGGELGADFLALEVGGAAFPFDVLVQLLAHVGVKDERAMFQSGAGESSAAPPRILSPSRRQR